MRARNSAFMPIAFAALACGTSTELSSTRPAQSVEERVQPIQESARSPQLPAATSPLPTPASEQVKVDGALLTLEGCQLTVESLGKITKHALPLPDGCTFGKRKAGGPVQIEPTDRGSTVLVISSKRLTDRECDTHVHGIIVGKRGVSISTDEQYVARCGADGPFSPFKFRTGPPRTTAPLMPMGLGAGVRALYLNDNGVLGPVNEEDTSDKFIGPYLTLAFAL